MVFCFIEKKPTQADGDPEGDPQATDDVEIQAQRRREDVGRRRRRPGVGADRPGGQREEAGGVGQRRRDAGGGAGQRLGVAVGRRVRPAVGRGVGRTADAVDDGRTHDVADDVEVAPARPVEQARTLRRPASHGAQTRRRQLGPHLTRQVLHVFP